MGERVLVCVGRVRITDCDLLGSGVDGLEQWEEAHKTSGRATLCCVDYNLNLFVVFKDLRI